jgi:DNA polymerase-3 subunit delta
MRKKTDLSYREARQEIESGKLRAAYYLRGDEDFLKRDLAEALVAAAVDPRTKDFNYTLADAGELDAIEFASLLRTPPMIYGKRLFHLRDAPRMSPKAREIAASFAKNPTADVILLIVDPRKWQDVPSAQRNPKLITDLTQAGAAVVTCWSLFEDELMRWVKAAFHKKGFAVSEKVASFFVEAVGDDLTRLEAEIEKLSTFASGEREVKISDIEAVTGRYREDTVYELAHFASEGRLGDAMRVLGSLKVLGEPHVRIVFWLGRHYMELGRLLLEGNETRRRAYLEAKGKRPKEVLSRSLKEAALHSEGSVRKSLAEIYEADISIKRRGAEPNVVMDRLIVNLAMIAGGRAR